MRTTRLLPAAMLLAIAFAPGRPAVAADFVGSESCRSCHLEAYEAWRSSPHARAMASLSAEQRKDARCLQCHARDVAQGGDAGVTCETCHGAGEYYHPEYVMRDPELARAAGLVMPDAKACLLCHDASSPSLAKFDAPEKMKQIDHWSAARAARAAKKAKADRSAKPEACPRPAKTAALRPSAPGGSFLARLLPPPRKSAAPAAVEVAAGRPNGPSRGSSAGDARTE